MALTTAITIAGNVTYDPELRQTRDSKPVVNLTVAVNPRTFDRTTNEWKDGEPIFYKASALGDLATFIAGSVTKGTRVILHGNMRANRWVDKESGVQKEQNVITIEDIGLSLLFTHAQVVRSSPKGQPAGDSSAEGSWGPVDETPW